MRPNWMGLLCLSLTMLASTTMALTKIAPRLIEPTNTASPPVDEVEITDLDSIPNYTPGSHSLVAAGVWNDKVNNDYVIFVL